MAMVKLNRAAAEALRREAQQDLDNNIQERALFGPQLHRREDLAAEYQERLLACADVLGVLHWATSGWDVKGCELETAETVAVAFSPSAMTWMKETLNEHRALLSEMSENNEGDYDACREVAYLVYVLERAFSGGSPAVLA